MIIDVKKISYHYDNTKKNAISNINTSFKDGEFVAIVGPTGSGKSTFIQNLNALIIPSSGSVFVDELEIKNKIKIKDIKSLRKKIGIVFQFPEYQLFEETVQKDILFGPKNFNIKTDDEQILKNVLDLVGLDESFLDKSPFELSGGERRKVAIAGILAFNPDVLIVDEPTAGLDPSSSKAMLELFKKLNKENKTIILVTHQMDQVLEYASRVLVFNNGTLMCDTSPISLFYNEDLVNKYNLDFPKVVKLVNLLKNRYPKLMNYEIKNIDDLIKAYKEVISL